MVPGVDKNKFNKLNWIEPVLFSIKLGHLKFELISYSQKIINFTNCLNWQWVMNIWLVWFELRININLRMCVLFKSSTLSTKENFHPDIISTDKILDYKKRLTTCFTTEGLFIVSSIHSVLLVFFTGYCYFRK